MRSLQVDLDDMAEAFDLGNAEATYYLDLEAGAVLLVMAETRRTLNKLLAGLDASADSSARLTAALADSNVPEWERELVLEAYEVDAGCGERYVAIPQVDSRQAYGDMEDFVDTVRDVALRKRLRQAIQGRGAFRQFKNVLEQRPQEEQRWYAFRDERTQLRMQEWLKAEGIEPI